MNRKNHGIERRGPIAWLKMVYWKYPVFWRTHTRGRRFFERYWIAIVFSFLVGMFFGSYLRGIRDLRELNGSNDSYQACMDRARGIDEQLRAALQEQDALRQERNECRARLHSQPQE